MRRSTWRSALLLCVACVLVSGQALAGSRDSSSGASVEPYLRARLAKANPTAIMRVFVHARNTDVARASSQKAGLTVTDGFEKVGVAVAGGPVSAIRRLAADPEVSYLEADRPIAFALDTANKATRGDDARAGFTGTDSSVSTGVDGTGFTIAEVDSGIDGTHPMFQVDGKSKVVRNLKLLCREQTPVYFPNLAGQGQVPPSTCPSDSSSREIFWADFTQLGNDTDTISAGGHGTHVAGIAAGVDVTTQDGRHLHGAAPGAKLVGLSIGDAISIYGGAAGLNWVLDHHADPCGTGATAACPAIRVVTNSWGLLGGGEFDPLSTIAILENQLVAEGVVVTFANGNDGGDGTKNVSSQYAQNPTPGVIGVANYDDKGTGTRDGTLASSSSRGQKGRLATYPDIAAPGTRITSACRAYLAVCGTGLDFADPNYNTISGTSMATPMVAGIAAQLLQAGATTPAQVENAINASAYKFNFGTGYDATDSYGSTSFDKGHGLVDAKAAVALVRSVPIEASIPPPPAPGFACSGDNVAADPQDDTWIVGVGEEEVPPYDAGLDILDGRLSWSSAASTLTATIGVKDLEAANGPTTPVAGYNTNFTLGSDRWFVEAVRGSGDEQHFTFGKWTQVSTQSARVNLGTTTGSFDAGANTVEVSISSAQVVAAGGPSLAGDTVLTGITFATRRAARTDTTTAGPSTDSTTEKCVYKIGSGSQDPPPPPPPPPPGSASVGQDYAWTGGPFTRVNEVQDPCASAPYTGCDVVRVDVSVPGSGATLTVTIDTENADVTDFDLYVYLPDGTELDHSADLGSREVVSKAVTTSGVYTIVVKPYLCVGASYSGLVHLS